LWQAEATYRRVSPTDIEIFIHKDETVILLKGGDEKIFYHVDANNAKTGVIRMFTDATCPKMPKNGIDIHNIAQTGV
jgi:hypothetical protein